MIQQMEEQQLEPKDLNFNTWAELRVYCPINIDRVVRYAYDFESLVNVRISPQNLNRAKRCLLEARGKLDLMITTLNQLLYDRKILETRVDEVLHLWLLDNLGRVLKQIDKLEANLVVDYDRPDSNSGENRVGIARLSSFAKSLRTIEQSLIFETLLKATKEYWSFDEKNNDGIERKPKIFLYILFHILQITIFTLGSISRTGSGGGQPTKKETENYYPGTWEGMLKREGQKKIADAHKEETGENIDLDKHLTDKIPGEMPTYDSNFEVVEHEEYDEEPETQEDDDVDS